MQIVHKGLIIPDELLEKRDRGEVVFFCGAGLCLPARMPTLFELAERVAEELGVPPGEGVRKMLAQDPKHGRLNLDQVFSVLQHEHTAEEIDFQISKHLRPKGRASRKAHKAILRLSETGYKKHRIVTTNLDLSFENFAGLKLKHFVAPNLPQLTSHQSLDRLVYLHGRRDERLARVRSCGDRKFVVSASDFGRAYLTEGWATRFVLDLLEQCTVVLLGYSADDPSFQCILRILQGLNARTRGESPDVYVFDDEENIARQGWLDTPIKPLAYKAYGRHRILWDALDVWAKQVVDSKK